MKDAMTLLEGTNTRILIAAMTFFALLVFLLALDDSISFGLLDSGWFPAPAPQ